MRSVFVLSSFVLLALALPFASANDPSPLQDFCLPPNDLKSAVIVKGQFCKDPTLVTADDFHTSRLKFPGDTNNQLGAAITPAFIDEFPGLATAGIAVSRVDYARGGVNPPHLHPRASEILTVMEGTLYVGFITSNPNNTLYSKILSRGESFIFPVGLIHFQMNLGKVPAFAIAAFSSQNPGVVSIANAVFDSKPPLDVELLSKTFQMSEYEAKEFQLKPWVHIINFDT